MIDITTEEKLRDVAKIFTKSLKCTVDEAYEHLIEVSNFTIAIKIRKERELIE